CGRLRHFRKDCPKLRNQNSGNKTGNKNGNKTENQIGGNEATATAYAIGGGGANPDSNVFTGHSFNIDLMPIELGSFDVIIGDDYDNGSKSNLNIISCTKTQKYMEKGCQVYLAQVTSKKNEDKSEEKRLEDVPIVREFLEVFPEDFPGLPPARQQKEHEGHLKLILRLLKEEELYAKFSKYEFWLSKVQFLGHVIDSEGIQVDPAKIESIKD
ncbi:hypothetical protein Tco_1328497, partial [Tanacetum coccineum]